MRSRNRRPWSLALGGLALALFALGAADEPSKDGTTVDVGGLTFRAPASWKQTRPSSSMRKAQLQVPPAEGDKEPAELAVFVFPERAGSVEANVKRWQAQFKDAQGKTPKVESRSVKGKNVDVTRVEVAGTYNDPFAGKGAQADYRLLGAIVETPEAAYFLKMVGPEKTMQGAEEGFDRLIGSIEAEGGK